MMLHLLWLLCQWRLINSVGEDDFPKGKKQMPTDASADDHGSTRCDSALLDEVSDDTDSESEWAHISDCATDDPLEGLWFHIDTLHPPFSADTDWSIDSTSDSSEDAWWTPDCEDTPAPTINPHTAFWEMMDEICRARLRTHGFGSAHAAGSSGAASSTDPLGSAHAPGSSAASSTDHWSMPTNIVAVIALLE